MANELVPTNIQIPAHLADRVGKPSALGDAMSGGISSGESFPRISIKGSRFRIVEGGVETTMDTMALEVIIVGANPGISKTWYAGAWDPNAEPTSPDCQSLSGISPDADSSNPQNDLCATCPQNAWGSKISPTGAKIKACADQKRLAVVPSDDPGGTVYLLQVSPAALKGLNAYNKELALRVIAPEIARTKIQFDTDASYPKLTFSFAGFNDEVTQSEVDKLFGSPEIKEITGEAAGANSPTPAIAAPVAEPEPTPAPAVVEPDNKVIGFGAAAKAAKAKHAKEVKEAQAVETPAEVTTPPTDEPVAATVAKSAEADELANEISKMVGEVVDDA